MSALQTVRSYWKYLIEGKGFEAILNTTQIVSAGEGKCTAEMVVGEQHLNALGTLHGGCTATLVDMISSMALITTKKGNAGVSVDMSISYLRAAPLGEKIIIEAKTNKSGKTLAFLDVAIKKTNGDLIATGTHTKFVQT
ncbi:hypothetical protein LSTR_LSTR012021 [Laodelphax striatellus]|uniref:Acyl-coenzyme A thioesterase 13 n=1 Tax=Laodelphax striatellus TaxID=195883 RepID=A0A482XN73_LAOST|nr:hypothetical protein LSTR_LSTR012021 [Laodelphax striatellus]